MLTAALRKFQTSLPLAVLCGAIFTWVIVQLGNTSGAGALVYGVLFALFVFSASVVVSVWDKFRSNLFTKSFWRALSQSSAIQTADISDNMPELFENTIQLTRLSWQWGDCGNDRALAVMCFIIRYLKAKRVFEIGTFRGRTTANFALNVEEDGLIFTLDLPTPREADRDVNAAERQYLTSLETSTRVGEVFEDPNFPAQARTRIVTLREDSVKLDFSEFFGSMDLVYVDGGHTLEVIASDTDNALKMVKPTGIIIWDDYGWTYPDVKYCLDRLSRQRKLFQDRQTGLVFHCPQW